jgi:hypothetical protein
MSSSIFPTLPLIAQHRKGSTNGQTARAEASVAREMALRNHLTAKGLIGVALA